MKILLVCVNYNSPQSACAYIDSISGSDLASVELDVVLVENSVEPVLKLQSKVNSYSWFHYRAFCNNVGYFGGIRAGLSGYSCRDYDYVICSNVDLLMSDPGFFTKLSQKKIQKHCMAIAPDIRSSVTGAKLNPYLKSRPHKKKMCFTKLMFRWYLLSVLYQLFFVLKSVVRLGSHNKKSSQITDGSAMKIYAPHGSFMIFTKYYFESGGDFNHPCFLYGEELYVAEQIAKNEGHVKYCPDLQVSHAEHSSTGWIKSRKMAKFQYKALTWAYDYLAG